MEISIFDVILLFLLSIAVSMIVGYNIIYIIDKKISSVNINIPPVQVPRPIVNIKINKKDNNKFDVKVEKELISNEEMEKNISINQKNEVTVNRKKNIESFRNILKNKLKKPKTNKIEDSNKIEIPEMDNVEAFGSYASFKKKN